jgi:hypothetical protein
MNSEGLSNEIGGLGCDAGVWRTPIVAELHEPIQPLARVLSGHRVCMGLLPPSLPICALNTLLPPEAATVALFGGRH